MEHPFQAPWWLAGSHAQTVWGRLARSRRMVELRREVLTTPDDDDLIVDHLEAPASSVHFVLLHGLEGSSFSVYIQGLLLEIRRLGHHATAMNLRFCARDPQEISRVIPNRRPRVYHSGDTADLEFLLNTLRSRHSERTFVAIGASLGGNILLKHLGERPRDSGLAAAATLSVPFDLAAGSANMNRGLPWLYGFTFLGSLKRKALSVLERFPETRTLVDGGRVARARSLWEFDELGTARLHGFAGAEDYYARSSSMQFLPKVEIPTLCIASEDDPLIPRGVVPRAIAAASPAIEFVATRGGGHVGFVSGSTPWSCRYWAEEFAVDWVARAVESIAGTNESGAR